MIGKLRQQNGWGLGPSGPSGGLNFNRGRRRQKIRAGRDAFTAGRDQTVTILQSGAGLCRCRDCCRDVPGFTGREDELEYLTSQARGGSVVVMVISGIPGVGKTALAVHAAHRLALRFPDGQLYADLHGYTEGQVPAKPGEVLEEFLRSLGVAYDELPVSMEERSGMLRQQLAARRVLMILDNAASESQVRPLLPGAGASLVVITSRDALAGLEVDQRIDLGVLPGDQASALLIRLIGQQRADAEPDALQQVCYLCGCLPLALRIAGQLLEVHKTWPVARLAGMLADAQHRLDHLSVGDRQVRAAFTVSYQQLPAADARLFRLLGLHPGPDFDVLAAASLALRQVPEAEQVLARLARVHLITEERSDRYGMHDLLRLFARETCFQTEDQEAPGAAMSRLVRHFSLLTKSLDAAWTRCTVLKWRRLPPRMESRFSRCVKPWKSSRLSGRTCWRYWRWQQEMAATRQ